jgi:small subunit ribosomal protein S9|tara:strand:+ start:11279 stop:11686 length:408 start_codon:yes stop_codon:yes gene_type:complete
MNIANTKHLSYGLGRRKRSIAQVRIFKGSGNIIINGQAAELYLQYNLKNLQIIKAPLETLKVNSTIDIVVLTRGGGLSGQAESIQLGIARAFCLLDPLNRTVLKPEGFLSRDSRIKERKKYGLKKARKAPQFSKR